jgi:hypothetical protein
METTRDQTQITELKQANYFFVQSLYIKDCGKPID